MHEQATGTPQYITMTEAAKLAPGRPSTSCVWRWCRRGVKARDGQRVRLEHVRVGGMIYTTAAWLEAFGRALADADAKHFDLCEASAAEARAAEAPFPRQRPRVALSELRRKQSEELDAIDRELEAEGL